MSYPRLDLDESLLSLDSEEIEFFAATTGLTDQDDLRRHIIAVQHKAYEILPYPCIQRFGFTKLKIARLPAYPHVLKLGQEQLNAILLDIGCCFGNDVRKAVLDGFPTNQVVASDLEPRFWDLGHELFKTTPNTFSVPFLQGDAFDDNFLSIRPLSDHSVPPPSDLKIITSLLPLRGHISAIHASSFFHLFDEAKQTDLAKRLAGLLKPIAGSIIFGSHGGLPTKGFSAPIQGHQMFCHSPDSWTELWDGEIFPKGSVEVSVSLEPVEVKYQMLYPQFALLVWSVKLVKGVEDTS